VAVQTTEAQRKVSLEALVVVTQDTAQATAVLGHLVKETVVELAETMAVVAAAVLVALEALVLKTLEETAA
jgi:hypothetical protein